MDSLPLVFAPNKIFKQIAQPVEFVNDDIRKLIDQMFNTMYKEKAVGLGANMVGILKRIVVVDLQKENILKPYTFINPEITWSSEETQIFTEASVCFLVSASKF